MTLRQTLDYLELHLAIPSGSCVALQYLNSARSLLWTKGDWRDTYKFIHMKLSCGKFYLPWWAASVKSAKSCGNVEVNELGWRETDSTDFVGNVTITKTGGYSIFPTKIEGGGQFYFSAMDSSDSGKLVYLSALNKGRSRLSEQIPLGKVDEKVRSDIEVDIVMGLSKQPTNGGVNVFYEKNGCLKTVYCIDPRESNLRFEQYCVEACSSVCLLLKVKKKHFPLTSADLDSEIDLTPEAILFAIKAIKANQDNNLNSYAENMRFSLSELISDRKDSAPSRASIPGGMRIDLTV